MNKTLVAAILATVVVSPAFAGGFASDELLMVRAKGFGPYAYARVAVPGPARAEAATARNLAVEELQMARAKGFGPAAYARTAVSGAVATPYTMSARVSDARAEAGLAAAAYFGGEDVLFARAKGHIN